MTRTLARIGARLRGLWPARLAGQLIALLLLALILAQAISLWIFLDERRLAVQSANRLQILSRTASIIRLLEDTPAALHEQILRTASTSLLRFWLADASAVDPADAANRDNRLQQVLAGHLAGVGVEEVLVDWRDEDGGWGDWWRARKPDRALIRPVGDADARRQRRTSGNRSGTAIGSGRAIAAGAIRGCRPTSWSRRSSTTAGG